MFLCNMCEKTLSTKSNLKRHVIEIHKETLDKKCDFKCKYCDKFFLNKKCLRQHTKKFHSKDNKDIGPNHSGGKSSTETGLRNINKYTFTCLKDFESWKGNVENSEQCHYIKHRGNEILKNGNAKIYYKCHRSGNYTSQSKIRHPKIQGTCKIGDVCPAFITATLAPDSSVRAIHYPDHKHSVELGHLHLTHDERTMIAGKLSTGVSVQRILDDIRNTNSDVLTRIHLITKKDIHNINAKYGFNVKEQYHSNDSISVELWAKQCNKLGTNNPVIFFKNQGDVIEDVALNQEDFLLVLMTPGQMSMLTTFAKKVVCIDSTHGLNAYDFQLTTLLVVDEFGEGFPVSFCISNRIDINMMTIFFNNIKSKVGDIETDFFMSDDAPAYLNAWNQVMVSPKNVLLCTWHVDKNWRQRIRSISKEKQCYIYKTLRVLLEELDKNEFEKTLLKFQGILKVDEDASVREFGSYFSSNYAKRKNMWAYSYRKGTCVNTNMHLEAVHKIIKHIYLDGKRCRRIDKCISILMKFIRDKLFDRAIKVNKGKITNAVSRLRSSCLKADNIPRGDIIKTDESAWTCLSQTNKMDKYIITKMMASRCVDCKLVCTKCNICVHTFTCTCLDYNIHTTICKHIHAVGKHLQIENNNDQTMEEDNTELGSLISGQQSIIANNTEQDHIDNLLHVISGLWATTKSRVTDKNDLKYLNDKLGDVIEKLKIIEGTELVHKSEKQPTHLKAEKQQRFVSTKKRKLQENALQLSKPTFSQKLSILQTIDNTEASVLNIHNDFDHVYE